MPAMVVRQIEGLHVEVDTGEHKIVVDALERRGGTNKGPNAPDLLMASLGACVVQYLARYCENADLDCKGIAMAVNPRVAPGGKKLVKIIMNVKMGREFSEERKKAFLRVAEQCFVHETLRDGIEIETVIEE